MEHGIETRTHAKVERSVSIVIPLKNLPDFIQGQRENTFASYTRYPNDNYANLRIKT